MKKLAYLLCLCLCAASVFARSSVEVKADIAKAQLAIAETKAANGDVASAKRKLVALRAELRSLARAERADRLDDGGETCESATVVSSLPYTDQGVIDELTEDNYEVASCGDEGSEHVYTFYVGEDGLPSGNYSVNTCGSDFDTVIELWRGCPWSENSVFIACNDDLDDAEECDDGNDGYSSCIQDAFLSPGVYYVTVAGYDFDMGDYAITIGMEINCGGQNLCLASAPNSFCESPELLSLDGGITQVLASSTLGGSFSGLPYCGTDPEACGLWYEVVGTGNVMLAHTCHEQTNYDTKINIYTGTCGNLVCVDGNDDWYGNDGFANCEVYSLASGVEWCSVEGERYFIFVNGYDGEVGRFNLTVEDGEAPCCTQEDYYFSAEQVPFCECLSICANQIQKIFVGPATAEQRPVATWHSGCTIRNIPSGCEQECEPASPELYMDWIYLPDQQLWCMDLISSTAGCYCLCIDRLLPVELNSFAAVAGDGEVRIAWSTASESNVDRYEVTRDGAIMTAVAAQNSATGASYAWTDMNVVNGTAYEYALVVIHSDGTRQTLATESAAPQAGAAVVTEYALFQNYPNPFNPSTSISFSLPEISNVTLKVVNAIGQEVAILANGAMDAGVHTVSFDGTNLPSGIYFYTLRAGTFSAQQKMVLIK